MTGQRACVAVVALVTLTGCGAPSVERHCEDVAVIQCDACFACDAVDPARACNLPSGTDRSGCETVLVDRCSDQAATLERPKRELRDCEDSLSELSCDDLVRSTAQGTPNTTSQCQYFL